MHKYTLAITIGVSIMTQLSCFQKIIALLYEATGWLGEA